MHYFLAVDIGASSGRHILGWLEDGMLKQLEMYRFENGIKNENGSLVWDTEHLVSEVKAGLKACKAAGKIPETVAIDTWAWIMFCLIKTKRRLHRITLTGTDAPTE